MTDTDSNKENIENTDAESNDSVAEEASAEEVVEEASAEETAELQRRKEAPAEEAEKLL